MVREGYNSITLDEDTMSRLREVQEEGSYKTIPETIRALLLNKKSEIDHKIELLMRLVKDNPENDDFAYLLLEIGATEEQEKKIYDWMDATEKKIREKKDVTHNDFEREIYKIFPTRHGDYHLAENIVGIFGRQKRWVLVYQHMKKDGMNI